MVWHKKAVLGWVLYWFIYIPLVVAIVIMLVIFPEKLLTLSLQPITVDSNLMSKRLYYALTDYDQFVGVRVGIVAPGRLDQVLTLIPSEKLHAVRVVKGEEEYFPSKQQKEFYQDAAPLVPVRYKGFNQIFVYKDFTGKPVTVNISQIFPHSYEKTRRK